MWRRNILLIPQKHIFVSWPSGVKTILEQLLHVQIPKVQNGSHVVSLFALLGSECAKAACRLLIKLTPGSLPRYIANCRTIVELWNGFGLPLFQMPHQMSTMIKTWRKKNWTLKPKKWLLKKKSRKPKRRRRRSKCKKNLEFNELIVQSLSRIWLMKRDYYFWGNFDHF